MIKEKDNMEVNIEYSIIPKLKEVKEISLIEGDTLVMYMDMEQYDLNDMLRWYEVLKKMFPLNDIMLVPQGSDFSSNKKKEKIKDNK